VRRDHGHLLAVAILDRGLCGVGRQQKTGAGRTEELTTIDHAAVSVRAGMRMEEGKWKMKMKFKRRAQKTPLLRAETPGPADGCGVSCIDVRFSSSFSIIIFHLRLTATP